MGEIAIANILLWLLDHATSSITAFFAKGATFAQSRDKSPAKSVDFE